MNLNLKRLSIPTAVLALAVLFTLPLFAHHPDLQTTFTVDQATQVPGKTLDSNTTYMIKVLKSDTDRHVVRIFNEDGSKMLTTFLGMSGKESGDRSGFSFMNMKAGDQKVVREWFYPKYGGLQFVYSEQEARDIRQHTSDNVLWTKNQVTANTTDLEGIQVTGIASSPSETEQIARNDNADLPRTAGELPLLAIIGLASLGIGTALRFSYRRSE